MKRPLAIIVSDHQAVLDGVRAELEAEFDVLALRPHVESVLVAAGVLEPQAVIVDLSRRSVRCSAMIPQVLEELPSLPLVALLDRESNPDVPQRGWFERGFGCDILGLMLTRGVERVFGGRVHAVHVETSQPAGAPPNVTKLESGYSLTFNC